jgi:type IV secretion system protein TrbG
MMRRILLTPLILAAVGCAATAEQPTTFAEVPAPAPIVEPPMPPQEVRTLVQAKPTKAKRRRTVTPKTVDAVTLFPFEENRIYPIATSPGYFTSIILEPGETMPGKAALGDPDPANWIVEKTAAGGAGGQVVVLLIKPGRPGISTNLFIPTNRRTYQLDVTAFAKRAMDSVRWQYPAATGTHVVTTAPCTVVADAFDPLTFDRAYSIAVVKGDEPRWLPVSAFSLGSKSYLEFPGQLGQIPAPALFLVDGSGMAAPAPFRVRGRWYEVDRSFSVAELRQGETVVRVQRSSGRG